MTCKAKYTPALEVSLEASVTASGMGLCLSPVNISPVLSSMQRALCRAERGEVSCDHHLLSLEDPGLSAYSCILEVLHFIVIPSVIMR